MRLPDNIKEEFVHALATYSRRYNETPEEIRLSAHRAAEAMLDIASKCGIIEGMPRVERVFYKDGILFVTVGDEDIEIPTW